MGDATDLTPFLAKLGARVAQLDAAYRASMDAAIAHLRSSGVAGRAKTVGDRAPDFALARRDGRAVGLHQLLRDGPVVLSFSRGEWCSFCRIEMDALIAARPRFVALGAQLVMVSPQGPTDPLLERGGGEGLTILHDPMNGVGLQYGLIFRMPDVMRQALLAAGVDLSQVYGSEAWLLPIPATYVIHPDGVIAQAHVDPDFTRRLDPARIADALAAIRERRLVEPA